MSRAAPKIVPLRPAAAGADDWFRDVLLEEKIAIERFLAESSCDVGAIEFVAVRGSVP